MGCKVALGELCSFAKGASVPRVRMLDEGGYLYIHYGDLYRGFSIRIDVDDSQKPIPYISKDEKTRPTQWLEDKDIVYVLTSETVEDLGHAFLFNNPGGKKAVAGTETTIVRVTRRDLLLPEYLNWLLQSNHFKRVLKQYVKGMKVFRVHPNDLARIEIDLPSLDNQRRVVAVMDSLFDRELLNNRINGYLAA
ncbi:restriction endonuclease subunit S [Senegalimassilia faecalis]|uniref:Restriction endonuclease subunit S n=1 Tax=Senegalimassilia faecalis TaxID=2509433 RepID=A0A4Q2K357_9ACTN|nr:restriction endonuclease subunit S [Senegalimassilia faecalis]RXZ54928.1 restriction endonuclease subunit S [Senegalimassilia faecalis]